MRPELFKPKKAIKKLGEDLGSINEGEKVGKKEEVDETESDIEKWREDMEESMKSRKEEKRQKESEGIKKELERQADEEATRRSGLEKRGEMILDKGLDKGHSMGKREEISEGKEVEDDIEEVYTGGGENPDLTKDDLGRGIEEVIRSRGEEVSIEKPTEKEITSKEGRVSDSIEGKKESSTPKKERVIFGRDVLARGMDSLREKTPFGLGNELMGRFEIWLRKPVLDSRNEEVAELERKISNIDKLIEKSENKLLEAKEEEAEKRDKKEYEESKRVRQNAISFMEKEVRELKNRKLKLEGALNRKGTKRDAQKERVESIAGEFFRKYEEKFNETRKEMDKLEANRKETVNLMSDTELKFREAMNEITEKRKDIEEFCSHFGFIKRFSEKRKVLKEIRKQEKIIEKQTKKELKELKEKEDDIQKKIDKIKIKNDKYGEKKNKYAKILGKEGIDKIDKKKKAEHIPESGATSGSTYETTSSPEREKVMEIGEFINRWNNFVERDEILSSEYLIDKETFYFNMKNEIKLDDFIKFIKGERKELKENVFADFIEYIKDEE